MPAATSVGVVIASSPNQVGGGALNSTLTPQIAGDVQNAMNQRLEILESLAASRPSLDTAVLGQTIGDAVGKQLKGSQKRSRSPDGAPEEPVAELINVHGTDDNHKVFCWEWRRGYKNPNAKPEDYWAEARYPLKSVPNLRGNLYLDHMIPMSISSKALGWAHNAQTQLEVKYFITANRSMKRTKKEGLKITQGSGDSGETHYAVDEVWEEADSIKDLLDGLYNMAAAVFQIRPWDWSILVIMRVCHDCGFFSGCSSSRAQQQRILEEFINEALFRGRTRLGQGAPPLTYQECYVVAESTVSDVNGRRHEVARGKGVYGGKWDLLAKEEEISKLTTQLVQARLENTQLRQGLKRGQTPTNTYATTGAVRGAGGKSGRGSRRQRNAQGDQAYVAKRNQMCAKYNLGTCADTACPTVHACSKRVGQGQVCGEAHPSKDHA